METTRLALLLLGTLFASFLLAYAFGRVGQVANRPPLPSPGGVVRIKCTHGVYRSRFLGVAPSGWRLTAPLSRDAYVPFREGEEILLEAAGNQAAYLARSVVLERDIETHELVVAIPYRSHRVERRETKRIADPPEAKCSLEDHPAELLDVSRQGARLISSATTSVGERVRLDLSWLEEPVFAWVLEVLPASDTQGRSTIARVRFEDPVALPTATLR